MKNIVIAIDFEESYKKLVDKGLQFALPFGAKIWLAHITAPDPDFVGYHVGPQHVRDVRAKKIKEQHKTLEQLAEQIKERGIEAEGMLVEGATVEMLVAVSKKAQAELLVVGFEGHGFLYKALVGETTAAVIKESEIPILVVPLKEQ